MYSLPQKLHVVYSAFGVYVHVCTKLRVCCFWRNKPLLLQLQAYYFLSLDLLTVKAYQCLYRHGSGVRTAREQVRFRSPDTVDLAIQDVYSMVHGDVMIVLE